MRIWFFLDMIKTNQKRENFIGLRKQWAITTADGSRHIISRKGSWVWIDGEKQKMSSKSWFIQLYDHQFQVGGSMCRVVVMGRKCDLAIDSVFVDSKQAYEPVGTIPTYATVLSAISCIVGFLMNKWLGVLLRVFYCSLAVQKRPTAVILTFIVGIVFQIVFGFLLVFFLLNIFY